MKHHRPALPFVAYLNLQSQNIGKLTLERFEVCVCRFRSVAGTGPADVRAGFGTRPFAPRALLRLTYRETFGDNLAGQAFWIVGRRDCARMAHADIALQ